MKYYIIQNGNIMFANSQQALSDYSLTIKELPSDYECNKYIVVNNELVLNPDWEEWKKEREKERIGNLKCTKRVLVLALKDKFGISYYNRILPLINSNETAKLEWELCEKLERKNPLLDEFAAKLNLLPTQIDEIFIKANL